MEARPTEGALAKGISSAYLDWADQIHIDSRWRIAGMENLLIPSAIQRIRSFLIEMSGMKVRPWATTEETLAALHSTLVARHQCQLFWTSLRVVLEDLARDLKTRQDAAPGTVVDNELLDGDRYQTLIDEIRAALESQSGEPSTFRRLASALSAPALGLLLLLGGATTVGCDESPLHGRTPSDAASVPGENDAKGEDSKDGESTSDAGFVLPPIIILDAAPRKDVLPDVFAPSSIDGGQVTIQDIMTACNVPDVNQTAVLNCLSTMRASWTTGMVQALAGQNCNNVEADLSCFVENGCWMAPNDFDPSAFICRPVMIYYGVRFV